MIAVVNAASGAVLGVYAVVEEMADRYRCDQLTDIPKLPQDAILQVQVGPGFNAAACRYENGGFIALSAPAVATTAVIGAVKKLAQDRLDAFAQARGYDGILAMCSYLGDANEVFAAEARCGWDLRSQTWTALWAHQRRVMMGELPVPVTPEEVLRALPALEWITPPVMELGAIPVVQP